MNTEVHIGKLICKKMKESGHTASWLARKMECHPSTIQKIFTKQHINTGVLMRISIILQYNFFAHYSDYATIDL
jgi:plasmid maintenance system antidote protein VapI